MRRPNLRPKLLVPLAGTICLAVVSVPVAGASPTPKAILAKRAEAQRVLRQISAIDERLNTISEQYDGARVRLQALRANLHAEEQSLTQARARYQAAQRRAAKLLVWLYTSSHASSLDVILGATTLGELLSLSDAENAISRQAAAIAAETQHAKRALEIRVRALRADRKAAAATVHELAQRRAEIERGLAERRRLLASVQAEVQRLEAKERARQARLAAEARARLRAEAIARAKAAAEARAKAAAEARARTAAEARAKAAAAAKARTIAEAEAAQATQSATTTDSATTATTATTTDPTTTTATAGPVATPAATTTPGAGPATSDPGLAAASANPSPVGPLPPGHPYAATLALQYLGVPYLWGGATPNGFDCSGLVTYVFAQLGIDLPHFAAAQWTYGVPVPVSELQPGDLVFFDGLDHVGIYLGNGQLINAPHTGSFVRIDTLSEPWYANHYVGARRI